MLILTRRIGESVIIGDQEITITILSQKGNQIRIGIEAPKYIQVNREEVYKRIQGAIQAAVNSIQASPTSDINKTVQEKEVGDDNE